MRIHKIFGSIVIFALILCVPWCVLSSRFFRKKTYVYLSFSDFFGVRIRKIQFCNLRCELIAELIFNQFKNKLASGLGLLFFGDFEMK